jgi:hypothetical protein
MLAHTPVPSTFSTFKLKGKVILVISGTGNYAIGANTISLAFEDER